MNTPPRITSAMLSIIASITPLSAQVACDTFTIKSKVEGSSLTFHLDTDLPEDTNVMVSISRVYQQKGEDSNFSLDYYSAKSRVSELKNPKTIELDNAKWSKDLEAKNAELSRLGLGFEVSTVSPTVEISMVVPIRQDNPAFGEDNSKLTGKRVKATGLRVVESETAFDYKIVLGKDAGKRPPSLDPFSLDVGQAYIPSKDTPLMPHHSPADPLAALNDVKTISKTGGFKVLEVFSKNGTKWYKVEALDSDMKDIGTGWVNSTALVGQKLNVK
jgi:hypothetical protein